MLSANILLQMVAAYGIPRWFPIQPDAIHSYPLRFKGGPTYFVPPWLGAYSGYGWEIGFALLGLFLLLLWVHREQIKRIH
jgi:hypothetical protein